MGIAQALVAQLDPIAEIAKTRRQKPAIDLVQTWKSSRASSPWRGLSQADVADRLVELIQFPDGNVFPEAGPVVKGVYQGCLGLCGPAAFLNRYLWRDPLGFAQFATQLYEHGEARMGPGAMLVTPDSALLSTDYAATAVPAMASNVRGGVCPGADWMVMGALQSRVNVFLSYDGMPMTRSIWSSDYTHPGDIVTLFQDVGVYENVTWNTEGINFAKESQLRALMPSGTTDVLLVVDSSVIHKMQPDLDAATKPFVDSTTVQFNHWLILEQQLHTLDTSGNLRFDAWTWGQAYTCIGPPVVLAENYFGAVVAQLPSPPAPPGL